MTPYVHVRSRGIEPIVRSSFSLIILLAGCFVLQSHAQTAAEAAGLTSLSSSAAVQVKPPQIPMLPAAVEAKPSNFPSLSAASSATGSPHLIASPRPPVDETNRRALSQNAGQNPSKLLLRSTSKDSQIWVDGKLVGNAPLLLVLAPGKYHIECRGPRSEYGQRTVDLLPRETREVTMKLEQLYPSRVTVRKQ